MRTSSVKRLALKKIFIREPSSRQAEPLGPGANQAGVKEDVWGPRLGSVIQGRYRLKSFLARGGMGAVFLCEDLRLTGQLWAIKEMLTANPEEVALVEDSFRREAEILSTLCHHSLPAVVDTFVEDSRHYVVMEFIQGETLASRVDRRGAADPSVALKWGLQLAEVLDYLHSQNPPVIFRDVKPENVMVTEQNDLKLVDFGLARHFRPGQPRDTQAAGSVGYSPPEQWEDSNQTDERSDIYGLGATLFFVLTGRPPTPIYGKQSLREHRPELKEDLEAVVLKCLQPHPQDRYPNCQALSQELQACQARPLPVKPAPLRKSRWLPILALTCLVLVVLKVGAGLMRPESTLDPMGMELILLSTAPAKAKARQALKAGQLREAISELDSLLKRYPQDGEAQILRSNAQALNSGHPVLRIPVFSSVTGDEYEGIQMLDGLALAQRELNDRGGVIDALERASGRKLIVLDFLDCQSRQDRTLELYLSAANNSTYQVAIGPWSSQQLMAVSPIVESAGFPTVAPAASDPRLSSLGKNSLTAADSDNGRVRVLAQHFIKLGLRRAVVVRNDESVVSHSAVARFREIFASLGGETVAQLGYLTDTTDYSPLLAELSGIRADCIFFSEYRTHTVVEFASQLRARGFSQLLGTLAVAYSHWSLKHSGKELNGLLTSSYFYPGAPDPAIQDFCRRYKALTGEDAPSHREANSYDTLRLVAQAIEVVGFERKAVRAYFDSLGGSRPAYRGVSGEFSPTRRLESRKAYLMEIRDGHFWLLPE